MTHQLPPEVRVLTEDDIYRTSSQFRVWSFSPESLAARRAKTHEIAIERIERQRTKGANGALSGDQNGQQNGEKLDYLTEEEEPRSFHAIRVLQYLRLEVGIRSWCCLW